MTTAVPSLFRQIREDDGRRPSAIIELLPVKRRDLERACCSQAGMADNFTIFEGKQPLATPAAVGSPHRYLASGRRCPSSCGPDVDQRSDRRIMSDSSNRASRYRIS